MNERRTLEIGHRSTLPEIIGLLAGPFLSMVDAQVVNIAIPDIGSGLGSPLATAQWTVSGYLLSLGAALATTGYLARRHGTERVYAVSLIGFTVTSALCAMAPSMKLLIILRIVQGALGAPLIPLATSLMFGATGMAEGGPSLAGILLFLAPMVGPSLGGILIRFFGWPSIFWINVPLGALGVFAVRRRRPWAHRGSHAERFDLPGFIMLAGGLVALTFGTSNTPLHGWSSPSSWPWIVSGVILLGGYAVWAVRTPLPILAIRQLQRFGVTLAYLLSALASVVMFSVLFLIPIFMQQVQHYSAFVTGLAMLPQGIAMWVGTILGQAVTNERGERTSVLLGMGSLAVSTAVLIWLTPATPAWIIALILCLRGLATGLTVQPLILTCLSGLDPREAPDANTLFNVVERISGSIGIAVLSTLLAARDKVRIAQALAGARRAIGGSELLLVLARAMTAGFHDVLWVLVVLAALGFLGVLLLPKRRRTGGRRSSASRP